MLEPLSLAPKVSNEGLNKSTIETISSMNFPDLSHRQKFSVPGSSIPLIKPGPMSVHSLNSYDGPRLQSR